MTHHSTTIGLDTETRPITPGNLAPDLACVSWCYKNPTKGAHLRPYSSGVLHHTESTKDVEFWLRGAAHIKNDIKLVGHHISFDMAVLASHSPHLLPLIFEAYRRGNIEDTQLREQLIDIADGSFWQKRTKKGSYSLKGLASQYLSLEMEKGADTYRLKYGELIDTPLPGWPQEAVEYSRQDAEATLRVYNEQAKRGGKELADGPAQARAAFALHLASCWGVTTDGEKVAEFVQASADTMACHGEKLARVGLMRLNGTKDLARVRDRVKKAGGPQKRTAKGSVATDEETLIASGDPDLALLVEFSKAQKLDSVWSRYLEQGTDPATPVQAKFHCLVESGRTSCSKPNLQNPHRATGLRECFIPRPGSLFVACDYSTLELCTLAQVTTWLFQKSNMAEQLQKGVDLHLHFAAQVLGISYTDAQERNANRDPEVREARQMAKVANFGYCGGMGANSFRQYAKGFGLDLTDKQAEKLREDWFKTWPEMRDYFKHVADVVGEDKGKIEQFVSGRVRGGVHFTQAANSYFQGLGADLAKAALFEVARLCYADPESALFGSRPVMFIHDEIVLESPADKAPEAAEVLAETMQKVARYYTPDIPIGTTVALMGRWYKNAEAVRDENGRLTAWRPSDD